MTWNWNGPSLETMSKSEKDALMLMGIVTSFCSDEDMLAVVDTSGSMHSSYGLPAAVALSLGLYLAEHNKGRFRNHFY